MIPRVWALIAAAGTEPAARGLARGRGNGIANLPNHRTFLLGRILSHSDVVGHAVAAPFPLSFIAFLDDRRMMRAHVGVQHHRRADPVLVENLHHAKYADARPIVPQGISGYIRQ